MCAERDKLGLQLFTPEGIEIGTEWMMVFDYAVPGMEPTFEANISNVKDIALHFAETDGRARELPRDRRRHRRRHIAGLQLNTGDGQHWTRYR